MKKFWEELVEVFKRKAAEPDGDEKFKAFHEKLGKAIAPYGDGAGLPSDHPLHALKALHKEMFEMMAGCGMTKSEEPPAAEVPPVEVPPVEVPPAEPTPEDVEKAAKLVDLEKKLADTEAVLKSERDATALAAEVTLLKSIKLVSVNPEADAPLFKSLKEANLPVYTRIMELIKGADAVVNATEALTTPVGSPLPGDSQSGKTAWLQIEAEAEVLRKEDSKITKAKAIDIVMKKRPDLVAKHNAETSV
jgi:hypothetical protein